jgi:hypothetical protein
MFRDFNTDNADAGIKEIKIWHDNEKDTIQITS